MALVDNQAALHSVYNHFLMAYAPTTTRTTRFDTHKKSELRSVYNSIVKQNKESPLYLIDTSRETQEFAVGMKENARELGSTISSLSAESTGEVLSRKAASSTNSDVVEARYIGSSEDSSDIQFDISVEKLASTQVNLGLYLPSGDQIDLPADTYSFDIHVNDTDYEFQFNIGSNDTNRDLQDKLSSLINRSNIGLVASVEEDGEGNSALRLESIATGLSGNQTSLFEVSDDRTSKTTGAVDYFGLNEITRPASNAEFTLNGIARTAFSNAFTVDKKFELTLKNISEEGDAVTIGLKQDVESMADNIHQLIDGFNSFIDKANAYEGSNLRTGFLLNEINRVNIAYADDLDSMGIHFREDSKLEVDDKQLLDSLQSEDSASHLKTLKNFTSSLMRKSSQISLNPMNYVQKTVVAYKNPGKSFANPYVTSMYSGMMFNGYC